jgi:hypothetical protein
MPKPPKPDPMPTHELIALLARGETRVERFVSSRTGSAQVELVGADGRRRVVTVTDAG